MYTVTLGRGSVPFGAYTVPLTEVVAVPEHVVWHADPMQVCAEAKLAKPSREKSAARERPGRRRIGFPVVTLDRVLSALVYSATLSLPHYFRKQSSVMARAFHRVTIVFAALPFRELKVARRVILWRNL
jgi:hypothetical protein